MTIRSTVALALLTLCPARLTAQLGLLDKVFSNVTDMNGHLLYGSLAGSNPLLRGQTPGPSLRGLGFEVSLGLGDIPLAKPDSVCEKRAKTKKYTPKEVVVRDPRQEPEDPRAERIFTVTEEDPGFTKTCPDRPGVGVELALGYSQLSGFQGKTLELRSSIEELPNVSVYFTLDAKSLVSPYVGFRAGLTQLKSFRFVSSDTLPPTRGTGSTYHVGLVGGLVLGPKSGVWGVFAEYAWTYRRLSTIDWADAKGGLPSALLGSVRLDTWLFAIGLQVAIGDGKDE